MINISQDEFAGFVHEISISFTGWLIAMSKIGTKRLTWSRRRLSERCKSFLRCVSQSI